MPDGANVTPFAVGAFKHCIVSSLDSQRPFFSIMTTNTSHNLSASPGPRPLAATRDTQQDPFRHGLFLKLVVGQFLVSGSSLPRKRKLVGMREKGLGPKKVATQAVLEIPHGPSGAPGKVLLGKGPIPEPILSDG